MADTHEPLDLSAIEARANVATPAPWLPDGRDKKFDLLNSAETHTQNMRDDDFIVHARDDVPELIAEVRRLRAIEARLKHGMCHGCEMPGGVGITAAAVSFLRYILTGEEPK